MAMELDTTAPARIVRGDNGKALGFTEADLTSAREWNREVNGKSGRGILADLTLLQWYAAGQPHYEAPVKSTGSTNVHETIATVTFANRRSDGTAGAKRGTVDVTRGAMRVVREGAKGAPKVADYVAASGKDDDDTVVVAVDTVGGKSYSYDYENDEWSSVSAAAKAADDKIAALMARIAELETRNGADES